jgi:hypothetical protein
VGAVAAGLDDIEALDRDAVETPAENTGIDE